MLTEARKRRMGELGILREYGWLVNQKPVIETDLISKPQSRWIAWSIKGLVTNDWGAISDFMPHWEYLKAARSESRRISEDELMFLDEELDDAALGYGSSGTYDSTPASGALIPGEYLQPRPFYSHLFIFVAGTNLLMGYYQYLSRAYKAFARGEGLRTQVRMLAAKRAAKRGYRRAWRKYGRLSLLYMMTFKALNMMMPWTDGSLNIPIAAALISLGYTAKSKEKKKKRNGKNKEKEK
jgi:hypothetical protein